MAKKKNYIDILLEQGVISPDQIREAENMAKQSGENVPDCIVRLGYASGEQVMKAVAQEHGHQYIELAEVTIPTHVVELVPESVARENIIMPMHEDNGALMVLVSNPQDFETLEKLRFILNRHIDVAVSSREAEASTTR